MNSFQTLPASSGNYDLWHKLGPKITHYTGDPWSLCHVLNFNSVAINHSSGYGITLFCDRYWLNCFVLFYELAGKHRII